MTVVMRKLIGVVAYFFVWNVRAHDTGFRMSAAAGRCCQFAGFITDSHRLFQRTAFFWLRTAGKILRTRRGAAFHRQHAALGIDGRADYIAWSFGVGAAFRAVNLSDNLAPECRGLR